MSSLSLFTYGILPEVRVVLLNVEAVTLPVTTTLPEAVKDVTPLVMKLHRMLLLHPLLLLVKLKKRRPILPQNYYF